jgi:hypothetical protein
MVFEYLNLVGCRVTCNTLTSVPDPDRMDPEFMASCIRILTSDIRFRIRIWILNIFRDSVSTRISN